MSGACSTCGRIGEHAVGCFGTQSAPAPWFSGPSCPGCAAYARENEFLREQVKTLQAGVLAMADPLAAARAATMTAQAQRIATPQPKVERKPPAPPHVARRWSDRPDAADVDEFYEKREAERKAPDAPVAAEPATRAEIEASFETPEA